MSEEYKTTFEMVEELIKAAQAILPIWDNENLAADWQDEFAELNRTLDALTRQNSGVFF